MFEELNQIKALSEFNRVLKVDGLMLLTGKNVNYPLNDDNGFIAEIAHVKNLILTLSQLKLC